MKIERIERFMKERKLEALLLAGTQGISYVLGHWDEKHEILLYMTKDQRIVFAPSDTLPTSPNYDLVEYDNFYFASTEEKETTLITKMREKIDPNIQTGMDFYQVPYQVGNIIRDNKKVDISVDIQEVYRKKEAIDIQNIQKALALNDAVFDFFYTNGKSFVGRSDVDIYLEILKIYMEKAGEPVQLAGDILVGQRTTQVSGNPNGTIALDGDTMILDLLPALGGYCCDTTRTFVFGDANEKIRGAYQCLYDALRLGEEMICEGASCDKIFRGVSDFIKGQGYNEMPHHVGHGVGFSRYEAPYIIPNSIHHLQTGDVITLEPGIYIDGQFGIRLENNYWVQKNEGILLNQSSCEFGGIYIE